MEKEQIKQTKHHKQDNDESNINIKDVGISIKTFFSNKRIFNKTTLVILLIIVAMFFSLYFRLYTETLPQTDNWAQNSIENYYKTQIRTKIDAEYPNLPSKNKDELVNKEYLETYKKDRIQIETTKTQISTQFKNNYQDESGQTYLLAIDPYTYYRQTRNLIEKGTVCDEIKDNKCWNNHMMAPLGREMQLNGHVVVQYVTYRISKIFNPNTSLTNAIFILPAIIIMLGIIPAFFITKKYAGIVGGFVAAMLIGLHPYLLGRTPAGFVDTDAYGITIALYLIWLVIAAYSARSYKKKILFAGLAGVTTWIFKQTWGGGWSFTFNILVAILIGMTLYQIIKVYLDLHKVKSKTKHKKLFHSRTIRSNLLILITYLLVTTILLGTSVITAAIKAPASASQFQNAAHSSLWPNVYTTVAELNVQSLPGITNALISNPLGQLMLFIAFLAIPLSLIKTFDKKSWYYLITSAIVYLILISKSVVSKINPNFYIAIILITLLAGILINLSKDQKQRSSILLPSLLTTLLVGCVFASVRGIRFVLLGINPFSIMIGLTIGILFLRLSKGLHKLIDIPKIATKIIVLILALVIIINYINVAHTTALNETPQMNDAWYESLTKIKDQAEEGAILTSWWDFGHWFKAVADRAVTFDGASQNTPMAHWVGKSLTTGNEDMTIGILRMLNCGSNEAFELLDKEINSPALTIDILNEIIIKDKINAKQTLLSKGISETNVNKILIKTHCNPPESYYITSQDMVSKAGVWAHFGLWDFKKADLYLNGKDLDFVSFNEKAEAYDYTKEETEALYDDINFLQNEREANTWISPWPGYVGTSTCSEENNIINCKINIKIGQQNSADIILENYVFDKNKEEGIGIIGIYSGNSKVGNTTSNVKSFTTVIEGKLKTYSASSGEVLDLGIVNINNKAVIGSAEVTNSIFTRLFYFDGAHTEHFEKFSDVVSETTNERIIIWKVNWEGNNNINPLQPVNISIS